MSETLLNKLEASRKELLDLGLRNPLLNYKMPASRGLHITQEKATAVYDILVKQGKGMTFLGKAVNAITNDDAVIAALPQPVTEEPLVEEPVAEGAVTDTKLQTGETDANLQRRLLNTYYDARTSIEEQGVNILYLSLGMVHWYEADNSQELRKAPLVLVPVSLERSSARERFRLRYTLEEMGANISLQAKMKAEFGIAIPDMPEPDDFVLPDYFNSIQSAIERMPRWKVEADNIELGFFSFGKFMIYNDLDSNKWPDDKKPAIHPLLINLFENGFGHEAGGIPEDAHIDKDTNAHELFQVVDADSSQLLAMLSVNEGKNLVIQGPPGTGKSQTITNLIANAIGQGKKVLFVAEKMAALEVVKRRLDNIHLGDACLELHSHKANKKELHQELRRVLELGKPSLQQLQQHVSLLESHKEELNAYCIAVNTPIGKSGLTTHQVLGYLLQVYDNTRSSTVEKVPLPDIENWDAERMKRAEAFANRVQARLVEIGTPVELLFWGSRLQVLLPHEQEYVAVVLQQAAIAITELEQTSVQTAGHIGVGVPVNQEAAASLAAILKLLSIKPDLKGLAVKKESWLLNQADVEELLETGKRLTTLREEYATIFIPEAWQQDVLEIRQNLLAHGHKWYKFAIGAHSNSNKQLAALCKATLPKDNALKLQYVDAILEYRRLEALLKEHEPLAIELFGNRWQKLKSDWQALEAANRYLLVVHKQVAARICPAAVLDYLEKQEDPAVAKKHFEALSEKLDTHKKTLQQVVEKLALDEELRFGSKGLLQQLFTLQSSLIKSWQERVQEIHEVILWNNLVETAITERLQTLTNVAAQWPDAKSLLKTALQKTWYEYLLQQATNAWPALRKFERASHETVVQQFRQLDKLNLQYNRTRAALKHYEMMPKLEAGGQVSILRSEFNKKARHKAIRKLVEEAGLAIQAIKPVFMMSPLSIANFLSPGSVEFDLVIFDEASQVRPVEALGAMLRGKQLVVVGDTKQLPPTSFFDSLSNELEDEDNVTADLPSILGMCDAQGASQRMLRWHYRSRHESLIMLSNHEFYDNKLVIFPSPGARDRMGLIFHHLKDTVYDRGKTRTNQKEAEIVADAVLEHARQSPKLSLGVVAFSTAQRQAIQDALEIKRRKNPLLETFFTAHADEPFFVKNLENVQGDERDVIFISIGYGRSEDGTVSMSFGPLNNDGGERRLNVLITRAKLRCEVFTNITADDIDLNRTKRYSIQALKSFLYFAQHGKLPVQEDVITAVADSPFEEKVAEKLTALGYTVRRQVGTRGFYIDLAIVDPAFPGRYIMGIECDGAAYHTARSARDRDRLRQQVLEAIGWRIYRVWSTDWFRNPDREVKRLAEAIERAKESAAIDDDVYEDEIVAIPATIERETMVEEPTDIPLYQLAKVPEEIAAEEIHQHSEKKLALWIEEIVKVESPVHFDEVARRMVEAAGVTRVGSRIRDCLLQAIKYAETNRWIKVSEDFLWHRSMDEPPLRDRSNLPATAKKIKYIAPEEMMLAVEKVVREAIAIQPEAAVPLVARIFGFTRVTEEMKAEILGMIGRSLHTQQVVQEGELLKMSN
jgi:very-short-patch-repair endonuclease